jgi:hypothetical protein
MLCMKLLAYFLFHLSIGTICLHDKFQHFFSNLTQVRRIMEGNHRMGMVGIDSATGTVADCGCEVEILE